MAELDYFDLVAVQTEPASLDIFNPPLLTSSWDEVYTGFNLAPTPTASNQLSSLPLSPLHTSTPAASKADASHRSKIRSRQPYQPRTSARHQETDKARRARLKQETQRLKQLIQHAHNDNLVSNNTEQVDVDKLDMAGVVGRGAALIEQLTTTLQQLQSQLAATTKATLAQSLPRASVPHQIIATRPIGNTASSVPRHIGLDHHLETMGVIVKRATLDYKVLSVNTVYQTLTGFHWSALVGLPMNLWPQLHNSQLVLPTEAAIQAFAQQCQGQAENNSTCQSQQSAPSAVCQTQRGPAFQCDGMPIYNTEQLRASVSSMYRDNATVQVFTAQSTLDGSLLESVTRLSLVRTSAGTPLYFAMISAPTQRRKVIPTSTATLSTDTTDRLSSDDSNSSSPPIELVTPPPSLPALSYNCSLGTVPTTPAELTSSDSGLLSPLPELNGLDWIAT